MSQQPTRDSLFASPLGGATRFKFNQAVVDVFPDMLRRSIPGYESIITQSGLLAQRYAQPGTRLYDLGSSLGATALALRSALCDSTTTDATEPAPLTDMEPLTDLPDDKSSYEIHAIDNSAAMIIESRKVITLDTSDKNRHIPVQVHEADLTEFPLDNASVVAMNFTLQFIAPEARNTLMARIANSLLPGGALILSEKVCFDDTTVNDLHIDMYHAFKSANGYSELEISQKRNALENVLVPDTLDTHQKRLKDAGFSHSTVWFQCFNFASIIAIK